MTREEELEKALNTATEIFDTANRYRQTCPSSECSIAQTSYFSAEKILMNARLDLIEYRIAKLEGK